MSPLSLETQVSVRLGVALACYTTPQKRGLVSGGTLYGFRRPKAEGGAGFKRGGGVRTWWNVRWRAIHASLRA